MSKPVETLGEEGLQLRAVKEITRTSGDANNRDANNSREATTAGKPKAARSPATARTARNVGETLAAVRTSTAVGMSVTTETLGTPEMSTAVRTTTGAGTPATIETITTADVAKVMAEDSLHVFFHLLFFFLHPFPVFSTSTSTCCLF
jgi:hypothetical protein